jgi:hypothetical protein
VESMTDAEKTIHYLNKWVSLVVCTIHVVLIHCSN